MNEQLSSARNFLFTFYPYFVEGLGFYGTFWMYGVVMCIEVVYGAISIPENKGQSLVKTEDKMINNGKKTAEADPEGCKKLLES